MPRSDVWVKETLSRANAYARAGASGVFVLGALSAATISMLVDTIELPLNVAFGHGTLSVGDLARAGASRVSAGSAIAEAAYSVASDWAAQMIGTPGAVVSAPPTLGWAAINEVVRD
ncbi:isocitrate lyase/phosphoenolpyruvate mutase family protein [Curtobacterium sp. RIT-PI-V]|uniref:isocitrate lyase/phosphoenolpyruvate mutase family protein n=1 Tax=Curtobacterium sp. RIT-PI-V TaxID=3035296 RepID=UPI0021D7AC90|nr:isocitrate lyase/phosphoenolpyruvate mutase family protein [Curtobacterium sp. RIT-PI-V]